MAQFDVHRNAGRSRDRYPYLVVVQSGLLRRWNRRVVIPLASWLAIEPDPSLNPTFEIAGQRLHLLAHEVGNVPREALGELVCSLADRGDTIVNALDLLFSRAFEESV